MSILVKKLEPHKHKFTEPFETVEVLRKYIKEDGKMVKDTMTGKDTLRHRRCACGAVETYDLERKKL